MKMDLIKKKKRKGFTLIELIVVIAILGILAAIAVPRFSSVTDGAKNKANLAENKIAVSAVQLYRSNHATNELPTANTDLNAYIEGGWVSLDSGTHLFETDATIGVTITSTSAAKTPVVTTTVIAP